MALATATGMKDLWQRYLTSANGYLELGMFDDAALEIEGVPPSDKNRKEVLAFRLELYVVAQKWEYAAAVGKILTTADPEESDCWIQYAVALRHLNCHRDAEGVLLRAAEFHPKDAAIRYGMACCASMLGKIDEAKERLKEAININPDIRKLALDEEELKPVWDSVLDVTQP